MRQFLFFTNKKELCTIEEYVKNIYLNMDKEEKNYVS